MDVLVVTPLHNEALRLPALAEVLTASTVKPGLWVLVDDGSVDGTGDVARSLDLGFPVLVVSRSNGGGLVGGSAFTAWQFGVDAGLQKLPNADYVMKLDADVRFAADYFQTALARTLPGDGLVGGVIGSLRHREQNVHVPGPVKLYTRAGYDALAELPRAVGFDVMDEVAIKAAGLRVNVMKDVTFDVNRSIGSSQGLVHGRFRNGRVCRWTGYWTPYFAVHSLRYAFRRPYLVGSAAMWRGYLTAGAGPYSPELRAAHGQEQVEKLRAAVKNPLSFVRSTYGLAAKA